MKANREDVVQAALIVERWCREHWEEDTVCDCPFLCDDKKIYCSLATGFIPCVGNLEKHLRNRGLKHD